MMQNWKSQVRLWIFFGFIFAGLVRINIGQQPGNAIQQPDPQPVQPAMGQAPFPPLQPPIQKYLDDVLAASKRSTKGIERFQCKFRRWQYDPTKSNDPKDFYTATAGMIRYMAPDQGMFKVDDFALSQAKAGW